MHDNDRLQSNHLHEWGVAKDSYRCVSTTTLSPPRTLISASKITFLSRRSKKRTEAIGKQSKRHSRTRWHRIRPCQYHSPMALRFKLLMLNCIWYEKSYMSPEFISGIEHSKVIYRICLINPIPTRFSFPIWTMSQIQRHGQICVLSMNLIEDGVSSIPDYIADDALRSKDWNRNIGQVNFTGCYCRRNLKWPPEWIIII